MLRPQMQLVPSLLYQNISLIILKTYAKLYLVALLHQLIKEIRKNILDLTNVKVLISNGMGLYLNLCF